MLSVGAGAKVRAYPSSTLPPLTNTSDKNTTTHKCFKKTQLCLAYPILTDSFDPEGILPYF